MPWQGDEHWDGFSERRHDDICHERRAEMKEWVKLKLQPSKARQVMMWSVMCLMLASSGLMTHKTISVAGDQKATDATQTSNISHNKEKIDAVVEAHEKLVETQENMQEELENINIKQERMMTILERIERKIEQ